MEELTVVEKNICKCDYKTKEDLGSIGNEEKSHIHIYKCKLHKTFMKHNSKTGEVL